MTCATRALPCIWLAVALALVGCGRRIPKASSDEVKNEVLDIARDYYNDQMSALCYQKVSGIPLGIVGLKVDYAWLHEHAEDDPKASEAIAVVDELMHTTEFSLRNLVTDEVDKEIGRISCSCDLVANGQVDAIYFTAQYTEDGELHVAVYNLGDK